MSVRIDEHDEFLLSRLLDGDLPEAEAAALRRRMEHEPALQAAFAAMSRLEDELTRRREDRPAVDWDRFHDQLMRAIETEARPTPATIQFPVWLRYALPLAAAAAIAFVVTLYRGPGASLEKGPRTPEQFVSEDAKPEPASKTGRMIVRFHRPTQESVAETPRIRIRFTRSQELAAVAAEADRVRREAPEIAWARPLPAAAFVKVEEPSPL